MYLQLLIHKWKQSTRSSFFTQGLGVKLLLGFFGIYMLLSFLALGFLLPKIITAMDAAGATGAEKFTSLLLHYMMYDIVLRYFFSDLTSIQARHYVLLNMKKSTIIHYLLNSSLFSFFNLLVLVILVPFFIRGVLPELDILHSIGWLLGILSVACINHFTAIYLKRIAAIRSSTIFILIGVIVLISLLDTYGFISLFSFSHFIFSPLATTFWAFLIPLGMVYVLYRLNYQLLKENIYEDKWLESNSGAQAATRFSFLEDRGILGTLIAHELKLIFRNKRTKSVFWLSIIFLLYGLIFYTQGEMYESVGWYIFIGIFITGGFMINYGQFITSWESAYWDGILTRNLPVKSYFQAKWLLFVFVTVVSFFITLPYAYFGWKVILVHSVALLFNIGFNSFILLFAACYSKKRIDLARSSMMNYQGTGAAQFLIMIPLIAVPLLIVLPFSSFGYENLGLGILTVFSLISLAAYPIWMREIVKNFNEKKYAKASGYRQKG